MDSTPYKSKLRSYSRLSLSQGNTSQPRYKTPIQKKPRKSRGKNPSPPPTPRANRSMNFVPDTPYNINSSVVDISSDETPKRKSARKSRLSEAPHLVTPGHPTKSCQTKDTGKVKRMKKLEEESRKIKETRDVLNQTADRIRQQALDLAHHIDVVTGALDRI